MRNLFPLVIIALAVFVIGFLLTGGHATRLGEGAWALNAIIANLVLLAERRRR